MNYDKFTLKLQSAIEEAAQRATSEKHSEVTPAHIIIALTEQKDGVLRPMFEKLGVQPDSVVAAMERILSSLPKLYGDAQVSFSRSAARILGSCDKVAAEFKDEYISAEHFLIALLTDECPEKDALIALGVTKDEVLKARILRPDTSRWTSTARISRGWRPRISSIQSSEGTRRSGG